MSLATNLVRVTPTGARTSSCTIATSTPTGFRRAGPDRDPPRLGAERRLRGHVPGRVAGRLCNAPHIEAALSRDGRQVAFSTVLEFDRGRRQRAVRRLRPRRRPRPHDAREPAAGWRAGRRRGGDAGPQRQRPHRRLPHVRSRRGVVRHQRRRRRLRGRPRSRRRTASSTSSRRRSPTSASSRAARCTRTPSTSRRDQRRRPVGRLRVAIRRSAIFDRSTGHNRWCDRPACPSCGTGQFSADAPLPRARSASGPAVTFIRTRSRHRCRRRLDEAGAVDGGPMAVSIRWGAGAPATDAAARLVVVSGDGFGRWTGRPRPARSGAAAFRHRRRRAGERLRERGSA